MKFLCVMCPVSPQPNSAELGEGGASQQSEEEEEEEVDLSKAMLSDPIVGVEVVVNDHRGTGARRATPLPTPKRLSPAQQALHNLTHLPFDEGCVICRATRGLNAQHRISLEHLRTIPLLVADYCFLRWSMGTTLRTVLVMRLYPYKLYCFMLCSEKGW